MFEFALSDSSLYHLLHHFTVYDLSRLVHTSSFEQLEVLVLLQYHVMRCDSSILCVCRNIGYIKASSSAHRRDQASQHHLISASWKLHTLFMVKIVLRRVHS